jgi:hypothetical protein
MKHYAGLDLSMESTQVCIIDENGRKLSSEKAESTPDAIADALRRHGPIERAVIETGRMSPAICLGLRELGVNVVCIDARHAPIIAVEQGGHNQETEREAMHRIGDDGSDHVALEFEKLQVGQIYYAPWCDENGHVVGDGLVFRMDETTFRV